MRCQNCGAELKKTDAACPYCGAMNAEGAERKFMGRLYRLKGDLQKSGRLPAETMKRTAGSSFWWVAAVMLGITIVITAWNVVHWKLEEWQERRYEEELQQRFNWQDIHFEEMDKRYEAGDLPGVLEYLKTAEDGEGIAFYQVQSWEHEALLEAMQICERLQKALKDYQNDPKGYQYDMERAVIEAFELGIYQTEERLERAADKKERSRLIVCIKEAKDFLIKHFSISEAELEQKAVSLEEDGFLSYSRLREFAEELVRAGGEKP